MWDGNLIDHADSPSVFVEREPMWDGNLTPISFALLIPVEREPMWDGNFQEKKETPKVESLSENQCGMETVDCSRL